MDLEGKLPLPPCLRCGFASQWRCITCVGSPLYCRACLHQRHTRSPWHRVQRWNTEGFYETDSLVNCGIKLSTGHGGDPCPTTRSVIPGDLNNDAWEDVGSGGSPQDTFHRHITVVDVSGIHVIPIQWCLCTNAADRYRQLLDLRLYPASAKRPGTAFTFDVLNEFLLINRACNTPAQSYFDVLRKKTDPIRPYATPNRYREFLRVIRQWRHLKARRQSGVAHDGYDIEKRGQMALFCPACPQPGINLAEDWRSDPERWKYRMQLVMDGNFAAEHQKMKNPEDDVWLSDGDGYFVGRREYSEHLKTAVELFERSTCNNHKAVNAPGNRNTLEATGIGATACARHGCFVPHSVVNFGKGEKQAYMDYSYANSIHQLVHPDVGEVLYFYDVICQWFVKLRLRVQRSKILRGLLHHVPDLRLVKGIGLFHVHGHKQSCLPRFSPDFIRGAGSIDGEVIETLWAILNDTSRATRGMTAAHRQEVIDDHMRYSNWIKLVQM
ncbi:hypothetical protein BDW22DRAFT_1340836, partial [Trametopsis cervina]